MHVSGVPPGNLDSRESRSGAPVTPERKAHLRSLIVDVVKGPRCGLVSAERLTEALDALDEAEQERDFFDDERIKVSLREEQLIEAKESAERRYDELVATLPPCEECDRVRVPATRCNGDRGNDYGDMMCDEHAAGREDMYDLPWAPNVRKGGGG